MNSGAKSKRPHKVLVSTAITVANFRNPDDMLE